MGSLLELLPALHSAHRAQHRRSKASGPGRLAEALHLPKTQNALKELQSLECSEMSEVLSPGLEDARSKCVALLRPKGPGVTEYSQMSRWANLLTSLPYAAIGAWLFRQQETAEGKVYAASLACVGVGAFSFHLTDGGAGKLRRWTRKFDYWLIGASTTAMIRALYPAAPRAATAASLLATPFQPFAVSAANVAAMEVEYARRAHANPSLRAPHAVHTLSLGVGMSCFFLEDKYPRVPGIHAVWHVLSAAALATSGHLLGSVQQERKQAQAVACNVQQERRLAQAVA